MHDRVGLVRVDGREHRSAIRDVERGVIERLHVVVGERLDDLAPDHPTRAGDDDPHGRAFNGSHHARLARYHSTVSASASSSVRVRFQPSAVILVMSTE